MPRPVRLILSALAWAAVCALCLAALCLAALDFMPLACLHALADATEPPQPASTPFPALIGVAVPAPGVVWCNTKSRVFHRRGRWYGRTKRGMYAMEADAVASGYRAAGE